MSSLHGGLQWGVDRMLSVGYGLLYDYIFEKFTPYQKLQAEVLALVDAGERVVSLTVYTHRRPGR